VRAIGAIGFRHSGSRLTHVRGRSLSGGGRTDDPTFCRREGGQDAEQDRQKDALYGHRGSRRAAGGNPSGDASTIRGEPQATSDFCRIGVGACPCVRPTLALAMPFRSPLWHRKTDLARAETGYTLAETPSSKQARRWPARIAGPAGLRGVRSSTAEDWVRSSEPNRCPARDATRLNSAGGRRSNRYGSGCSPATHVLDLGESGDEP